MNLMHALTFDKTVSNTTEISLQAKAIIK